MKKTTEAVTFDIHELPNSSQGDRTLDRDCYCHPTVTVDPEWPKSNIVTHVDSMES